MSSENTGEDCWTSTTMAAPALTQTDKKTVHGTCIFVYRLAPVIIMPGSGIEKIINTAHYPYTTYPQKKKTAKQVTHPEMVLAIQSIF